MTRVEDIEAAVQQLPPEELAAFRVWFELYDGERYDRRIEADAAAGRLDRLAEEALADLRAGFVREA